jgi:hypothetical protein
MMKTVEVSVQDAITLDEIAKTLEAYWDPKRKPLLTDLVAFGMIADLFPELNPYLRREKPVKFLAANVKKEEEPCGPTSSPGAPDLPSV